MNKLILGTAAFGSDYGIKHDGQPSIKEIEKIAQVAWDGGIRIIHTSWQYNLPKIYESIFNEFEWIMKDKEHPEYFYWNDKIGISLYKIKPFKSLYKISFIQIPVNILQRNPKLIFDFDCKIIARSVFLQGLLLMKDLYLPVWLSRVGYEAIQKFHIICNERQLEYHQAALGYVLGLHEIDYIIVGVNNAEQLRQLLEVKPLKWDYDFSITDENVLDPRKWPKS